MTERNCPNRTGARKAQLRAFEQQAVLRYHDLPVGVGSKTMRALIAKGLVELVDENIVEYAKRRSWRRTKESERNT
jgi:hypothetical protein